MKTFLNFKKIHGFYFLFTRTLKILVCGFIFTFLFFSFLSLNFAQAVTGVPEIINFQGRLMDPSGNLLGSASGTDYCYRFGIWDVSTGGTANPNQLWPGAFATPTTMTIVTRSGVFDASIGGAGGDTLNFNFQDNDTIYINVEVATKVGASCTTGADEVFETLDPRPQIVSSGFAINSNTAGTVTAAAQTAITSLGTLTGLTVSGNLSLTSTNTTQVTTASALALNVNSLTVGTGFYVASSSLSSGSLIDLAITGTAGLTNQKGLNISLSGANATGAQTTYGAYLSNTHTGTSNNVCLYATASGGTNNYAAIFEAGNVGIGTTGPAALLHLVTNNADDSGGIRMERTSATTGRYNQYISSTGDFTLSETAVGTRLTIQKTTGNLGINTTTPLTRLDVAGNVRTTGKATAVLTGTIDPAASTTVTGVGTLFTTELVIGDRITVTG